MNENRPFVVLNAAMTVDGKIDTAARQGAVISSEHDWDRVDRLRAESDAVMVGGRTLLGDDPRLLVKSPLLRAGRVGLGQDENPIKVGILSKIEDPRAGPTLHANSRFVTAGPARKIVFTTEQTAPAQIARLSDLGVVVVVAGESRVDLAAALLYLREQRVARLLVEGGSTLNAELLQRGLVDEIYLYIAPVVFGGASAPNLVGGEGLRRDEAIHLHLLSVQQLEDGAILLHYALPHAET